MSNNNFTGMFDDPDDDPSMGDNLRMDASDRMTGQYSEGPAASAKQPPPNAQVAAEAEMASMERDTEVAVENGADGVVFGILQSDGRVDNARSQRIRQLIGTRQAVFHRAFDVTPDPFEALEQLVDLGITRVLTSGQRDSVSEGVDLIKKLIERASDRIEILPGGGIQDRNLKETVERTGCRQVHMTAWGTASDTSTQARPGITFGGSLYPSEDRYQMTDAKLVRQLSATLRATSR